MLRTVKEERFRYLNVSRNDQRWGLYLNATGMSVQHRPGLPNPGHPQPYYFRWDEGRRLQGIGIAYVTSGQGEIETEESGHQTVHTGSLFLLMPNVWHRYRPDAELGWSYHWLHCDGDYVQHLLHNQLIDPKNPLLNIGVCNQVLRPFMTLQERVHANPPGLQQLAAANIIEILGSGLAAPRTKETSGDSELSTMMHMARSTMEEQVCNPLDMEHLANTFGMSYNYFRRVFREEIGIAPHQYFLRLRIDRAKELLATSDMPVHEIAYLLQFDCPNYFSRVFRSKVGVAPSVWRSQSNHSS